MTYNKESIITLDFKDAVRTRVGMYLGDAGMNGVYQAVREIITNSIDEHMMGFGKKIEIILDGNKVTVRDYARGVPFGAREDGVDAMIAIYTMPHSGGKFDEKAYRSVAGLNGIGAKATALSAKTFSAVSFRGKEVASLRLEKGVTEEFAIGKNTQKYKDGTMVSFEPDPEVFHLEDLKIDPEYIKDMCQTWAYIFPGLEIEIKTKSGKVTYKYDGGIKDLVSESVKRPLHKNIIYHEVEGDNGARLSVAFQWSKDRRENIRVFTNGLENINGGTSLTGAKTGLTRTVNNLSGIKLSGDSIRTGFVCAINASVSNPSFSDQTKTKINNPELRTLADKAITEALKLFAAKDQKSWEALIEVLVKEEKAEKAAEAAREKTLAAEREVSQVKKKNIDLPIKAVDATNKTGYREIFLTEGDSASSFLKSTRDSATQAVMPLRGKILNAYDLEFHEAYENQEIKDIFTLLGCGAGKSFNINKLRYNKIIIASDGDEDGSHISLLIIALLLQHAPEIINQGFVYRVIPPFYAHKDKYFYSDEELNTYLKTHPNIDYVRYKGLGAMNENEVARFITGKERKLMQIKFEDIQDAYNLFDVFLGSDIERRRELVARGEWLYD